ncbi:winged helix-turn-helix domain-containing protein [Streptomyces chengbuensis]|uniref:winged helix-turn-helix domain-containing protein n=1 Tax=Streptomyces TaxID=1883 RepID=UPI0025B401A5|nr:winged helix-turn-helix domain-containing protein [Streptomyces sp. HUAS CB01]WJY51229.1 winged helix-turn-helix domain-containing protein [Streptomyces sp. HUAS CB01]
MNHENGTVNGRKPTHHDIADVLRDRIDSGVLRPGDHMPTQSQLVQEFGVERGTVRQALRILQEDGLLTHVTRGAPARVAERPEGPGDGEDVRPQPTMVALAPQLAKAFSVPEVRVDALCLTAETLMLALAEPLRLIHEGRIRPEAVEVRLLLPDRNIDLAFPTSVADTDEDDLVHQRWLAQRNAQGMVLRHNLQALRASHGIDVTVAFRALPFTPPVKLYVLNGTEALFAYYTVTRREEEIEATTVEMYDTLGTQSLLFPFDAGNGTRDAAFVEQSRKWFDALWNTIATNLTLSS